MSTTEKIIQPDNDLDKSKVKAIFREGYYAGNYKARSVKGSAIMEKIIDDDFEVFWNTFNK